MLQEKMTRPNFFLYWAAGAVNLLSINSASMFSWSSPSIPKLTSNDSTINPIGRPITSTEESLIASLSILGSIIGTIIAGILAEKFGRKRTLIIFSMPFFFCYLIIANASHIVYFYITRFILGLSGGCVLSVLPSYVGEISEDSNRGTLGNFFGIMNSLGHLLSFTIGPLVSIETFAYILVVPVTLFFITFIPFVPESPYYFLSKGDTDQARKSLRKIRNGVNIDKEFMYLESVIKHTQANKVTWHDIMSSPATKKGLIVCCGLLVFQQSLGIGVVLLYLQPILNASGTIIPSYIASVLIGIIQVISCIATGVVIDCLGRKILLHISSAGCSLSFLILGTYFLLSERNFNLDAVFWLPAASLVTFFTFFNFGYATLPFIICGELFATDFKSFCASFATCLCLISTFLVSFCFPFLRDAFGMSGVFLVFAGLGALASLFVYMFVPETKGKSFQEIQYKLSGKVKLLDES